MYIKNMHTCIYINTCIYKYIYIICIHANKLWRPSSPCTYHREKRRVRGHVFLSLSLSLFIYAYIHIYAFKYKKIWHPIHLEEKIHLLAKILKIMTSSWRASLSLSLSRSLSLSLSYDICIYIYEKFWQPAHLHISKQCDHTHLEFCPDRLAHNIEGILFTCSWRAPLSLSLSLSFLLSLTLCFFLLCLSLPPTLCLSLPPSLCLSLYIYILCNNIYIYIQIYTNDYQQAFQTTYTPGIPPWLLRACPQRWWCAHGAPFRRVLGSLWNLLHSAVICMCTYIYMNMYIHKERDLCI